MYLLYPPRYDYQCECGNQRGSRFKSPETGLFICKACNRRYEVGTQNYYLDDLERHHQANLAAKKAKDKTKRERKKLGIINPTGGKEFDTPEFRAKQALVFSRKKYLTENAMPSELRVKELLDDLDVWYIFQKSFIAYDYYAIVDFYIPSLRLCLEIDGGYHNTPEQQRKDLRRTEYLEEVRGFTVYRLTNEETELMGAECLKERLEGASGRRLYNKLQPYPRS